MDDKDRSYIEKLEKENDLFRRVLQDKQEEVDSLKKELEKVKNSVGLDGPAFKTNTSTNSNVRFGNINNDIAISSDSESISYTNHPGYIYQETESYNLNEKVEWLEKVIEKLTNRPENDTSQ